jgi:hypothetical protein
LSVVMEAVGQSFMIFIALPRKRVAALVFRRSDGKKSIKRPCLSMARQR